MNKKAKKIVILALPAVSILLATVGLSFMISTFDNKEIIDNSKLFIGIPKEQENREVELIIDVKSKNGVNQKSFSSNDLNELDGQSKNIVFYDYGAKPLVDTNSLTIGDWLLDKDNVIEVKTIALDLIESYPVRIDKPGIRFINAASENGEKPDVSHSYYYEGFL